MTTERTTENPTPEPRDVARLVGQARLLELACLGLLVAVPPEATEGRSLRLALATAREFLARAQDALRAGGAELPGWQG